MDMLVEQLINGLTIGSFYALVAIGYSMVYGVMKLINFAHGDLFTLGSYFGYTLLVIGSGWVTNTFGIWGGVVVATLGAMLGVGTAGLLLERAAYSPVYKAGRLPLVVSALGASILFRMGLWQSGVRVSRPTLYPAFQRVAFCYLAISELPF